MSEARRIFIGPADYRLLSDFGFAGGVANHVDRWKLEQSGQLERFVAADWVYYPKSIAQARRWARGRNMGEVVGYNL